MPVNPDEFPPLYFRYFYKNNPETREETKITFLLERFVIFFVQLLIFSIVVAWVLTTDYVAFGIAAAVGLEISPTDTESAWVVLSVPLVQLFFCSVILLLIFARSYQVYSLSSMEQKRIRSRARSVLAPVVVSVGVLTVIILLYLSTGIDADFRVIEDNTVAEEDSLYPYHEQLTALWGTTIYSTAAVTGAVGGMYYNFKLRTALLGATVFALCSILLYPQTVLLLF